jgi:hypothetical protein
LISLRVFACNLFQKHLKLLFLVLKYREEKTHGSVKMKKYYLLVGPREIIGTQVENFIGLS